MSQKIIVFVDSDVVISSIISKSGAAHLLLITTSVQKIISDVSRKEITEVAMRLDLKNADRISILRECQIIKLNDGLGNIKRKYERFVHDINDAHIVAGTVSSKSKFLITYNRLVAK